MTDNSTPKARVIAIVGEGPSSWALLNDISKYCDIQAVYVEPRPSKTKLVRRRIQKLGVKRVADQLLFQTIITPVIGRLARQRIREIQHRHQLQTSPPRHTPFPIIRVADVDTPQTLQEIHQIAPDLIVINGTRILPASFLNALTVPIVNIHAGCTPQYRGVHGGYWALAEQNAGEFGVTLHRVDAGIDTGAVIAQARILPEATDSFSTYPWLQLSAGLSLLREAVAALMETGELPSTHAHGSRSKLHSHPGATDYLYRRWMFGVR